MDFNIHCAPPEFPAHKTGFCKWEADVEHRGTVYTFVGFTKRGAEKKAADYHAELLERDTSASV